MLRSFFASGLFLVVFCLSVPSAGQEFLQSARSIGMGGAGAAAAHSNQAIYLNPAALARSVQYQVDAGYGRSPAANLLTASVVDSETNPSISAGVGYSFLSGYGDFNSDSGHEIRLSAALPVLPDQISFGVGGRYLIYHQGDVELLHGITLDAGVLFRAAEQLHLGFVGRNLIEQCNRPECERIAPLEVGGGLSFGGEQPFTLAADTLVELSDGEGSPTYRGGAEFVVQELIPIRAGYFYRTSQSTGFVSAGGGWSSDGAGLDLGVQFDTSDPSLWTLQVSMSVAM